ncbi:MAG: sigma-70 family RNA polymerase sigma factor, partial [Candidatus Omnitrophica bacterium]|nr:sigma-70 family RNA polymerase sigma factor [Candidatus Omnitrophota bacterium]
GWSQEERAIVEQIIDGYDDAALFEAGYRPENVEAVRKALQSRAQRWAENNSDPARVTGNITPAVVGALKGLLARADGLALGTDIGLDTQLARAKQRAENWLTHNAPELAPVLKGAKITRAPPAAMAEVALLEDNNNVQVFALNRPDDKHIFIFRTKGLVRTLIHEAAALAGWTHEAAEAMAQKYTLISFRETPAIGQLFVQPENIDWTAFEARGELAPLKHSYIGETDKDGRINITPMTSFIYRLSILGRMEKGWQAFINDVGVRAGQVWLEIVLKKEDNEERRRFILVWGREITKSWGKDRGFRKVWGLEDESWNLAQLLKQDKDVRWEEQSKDILRRLKGNVIGETKEEGGVAFMVEPYFNYRWIVVGRREKGWQVVISDAGLRGGQPWVRVTLRQGGLEYSRKFVLVWGKIISGVAKKRKKSITIWALEREKINLKWLMKQPRDVDWELLKDEGLLERLKGCPVGVSDSHGSVSLYPEELFRSSWSIVGREELGWKIVIRDIQVRYGQLRIGFVLRKGDEKKIRWRIFVPDKKAIGIRAQKTRHILVWGPEKEHWNLNNVLTQPSDVQWDALKDAGVLKRLRGLVLGRIRPTGWIRRSLVTNFRYVWPLLGFYDDGWKAKIKDAGSEFGQAWIEVELKKKNEVQRRAFVLVWGKMIRGRHKDKNKVREVWRLVPSDIVTRMAQYQGRQSVFDARTKSFDVVVKGGVVEGIEYGEFVNFLLAGWQKEERAVAEMIVDGYDDASILEKNYSRELLFRVKEGLKARALDWARDSSDPARTMPALQNPHLIAELRDIRYSHYEEVQGFPEYPSAEQLQREAIARLRGNKEARPVLSVLTRMQIVRAPPKSSLVRHISRFEENSGVVVHALPYPSNRVVLLAEEPSVEDILHEASRLAYPERTDKENEEFARGVQNTPAVVEQIAPVTSKTIEEILKDAGIFSDVLLGILTRPSFEKPFSEDEILQLRILVGAMFAPEADGTTSHDLKRIAREFFNFVPEALIYQPQTEESPRRKRISSDDTIGLYLQEISRHPLLTTLGEIVLNARVRMGDERAVKMMVNSNLRFVVSKAKYQAENRADLLDLIGEGNTQLIPAAKDFKAERGVKFATFASWRLFKGFAQYKRENRYAIRLPHHVQNELSKFRKACGNAGLNPSDEYLDSADIAQKIIPWMELTSERIDYLRQVELNVESLHAQQKRNKGKLETDKTGDIGEIDPNLSSFEDEELAAAIEARMRPILEKQKKRFVERLWAIWQARVAPALRYERETRTLKHIGEQFNLTRSRIQQQEADIIAILHRVLAFMGFSPVDVFKNLSGRRARRFIVRKDNRSAKRKTPSKIRDAARTFPLLRNHVHIEKLKRIRNAHAREAFTFPEFRLDESFQRQALDLLWGHEEARPVISVLTRLRMVRAPPESGLAQDIAEFEALAKTQVRALAYAPNLVVFLTDEPSIEDLLHEASSLAYPANKDEKNEQFAQGYRPRVVEATAPVLVQAPPKKVSAATLKAALKKVKLPAVALFKMMTDFSRTIPYSPREIGRMRRLVKAMFASGLDEKTVAALRAAGEKFFRSVPSALFYEPEQEHKLDRKKIAPHDIIGLYSEEIGRYPLLTVTGEIVLNVLIRLGDARALKRMLNSNLYLVVSRAKQETRNTADRIDLVGEGSAALIPAIKAFKAERGTRFATFANLWVFGTFVRYKRKNRYALRVPSYIHDELSKFWEACRLVGLDPFNEYVESAELARKIPLFSEERIDYLRQVAIVAVSLDSTTDDDDGPVYQRSLKDIIGTTDPNLVAMENVEVAVEVARRMPLFIQQQRERYRRRLWVIFKTRVLPALYFETEELTLEAIGQQFGGLTREAIRCSELKVIADLHKILSSMQLEPLDIFKGLYGRRARRFVVKKTRGSLKARSIKKTQDTARTVPALKNGQDIEKLNQIRNAHSKEVQAFPSFTLDESLQREALDILLDHDEARPVIEVLSRLRMVRAPPESGLAQDIAAFEALVKTKVRALPYAPGLVVFLTQAPTLLDLLHEASALAYPDRSDEDNEAFGQKWAQPVAARAEDDAPLPVKREMPGSVMDLPTALSHAGLDDARLLEIVTNFTRQEPYYDWEIVLLRLLIKAMFLPENAADVQYALRQAGEKFFRSVPEVLIYQTGKDYHDDRKKIPSHDIFRLYLQEIGRHPLLTVTGEVVLNVLIRLGDERAVKMMVNCNLRFVVTKVKNETRDKETRLDLIAEGNAILRRAAQGFKAEKGTKFATYASWWLFKAFQDYKRKNRYKIRIPFYLQDELRKFLNACEQIGVDPGNEYLDSEDLALQLPDFSVEKIDHLRQVAIAVVSLDPRGDEGAPGREKSLRNSVGTTDPNLVAMENAEVAQEVAKRMPFFIREQKKRLQKRFEVIFQARILPVLRFEREEMTLKAIGENFGKVNGEAVRQNEVKVIRFLHRILFDMKLTPEDIFKGLDSRRVRKFFVKRDKSGRVVHNISLASQKKGAEDHGREAVGFKKMGEMLRALIEGLIGKSEAALLAEEVFIADNRPGKADIWNYGLDEDRIKRLLLERGYLHDEIEWFIDQVRTHESEPSESAA